MNILRLLSRSLQTLSIGDGRDRDPAQRVLLMYHGVSDKPMFNCVTTDQLRAQLKYVQARYEIVRVTELIEAVTRGRVTAVPLLALTFDDAYENFLISAYPILRELKLPAGVSVPSGHVGGVNRWDVARGSPVLQLMSWEQLRELDPSLIEFGSHSVSHRPLGGLSETEVREEVRCSKEAIEQHLSCKVRWFAFPYGNLADIPPMSERILMESGYLGACSTRWGRFNRPVDQYALRRIDVWEDDTLEDFKAKLSGYYDWLAPKEAVVFRLRCLVGGRRYI